MAERLPAALGQTANQLLANGITQPTIEAITYNTIKELKRIA